MGSPFGILRPAAPEMLSLPESAPDMRLVVVVDQFEEVFTLCHKEELRESLIRNLLYSAKVTQGQTLVILTMRADFYAKCAVNVELAAAFSDHQAESVASRSYLSLPQRSVIRIIPKSRAKNHARRISQITKQCHFANYLAQFFARYLA